MKAKQFFYAMGQQAKSLGVNKHRALRTYHLGAAPPYAKHAFIAGWEAQEATQVIEYRYEELDDRAKTRAYEALFCWEDIDTDYVLEAACEDDEERWYICVDRIRAGGRKGVDIAFETNSYCCVDNVTMDAYVCLDKLVRHKWAERSDIEIIMTLFDEYVFTRRLQVTHKHGVSDVEVEYTITDARVGSESLFSGARLSDLFEAVGGDDFAEALHEMVCDHVDDFKRYVAQCIDDEYAYIQSEEYVQAMCDANEYRFDESGALL